MKLSTAIREGSKLVEQCFGSFFCGDIGACTLGAAYQYVHNVRDSDIVLADFDNIWPLSITEAIVSCPQCDLSCDLTPMIIHLNDDHQCSITDIADWVESIGY